MLRAPSLQGPGRRGAATRGGARSGVSKTRMSTAAPRRTELLCLIVAVSRGQQLNARTSATVVQIYPCWGSFKYRKINVFKGNPHGAFGEITFKFLVLFWSDVTGGFVVLFQCKTDGKTDTMWPGFTVLHWDKKLRKITRDHFLIFWNKKIKTVKENIVKT